MRCSDVQRVSVVTERPTHPRIRTWRAHISRLCPWVQTFSRQADGISIGYRMGVLFGYEGGGREEEKETKRW